MSDTIDVTSDRMLTLTEVAAMFKGNRFGTMSRFTIWRWTRVGVNGVRLEAKRIGRRLFTTERAVKEFVERLSADLEQPPAADSVNQAPARPR